jgi:hypothetical protein
MSLTFVVFTDFSYRTTDIQTYCTFFDRKNYPKLQVLARIFLFKKEDIKSTYTTESKIFSACTDAFFLFLSVRLSVIAENCDLDYLGSNRR